MSEFDELFGDALDALKIEHGAVVSYVNGEGATVEFTAVGVSPEALNEIDDPEGGKIRRHVRDVEVYKSDYAVGINDELTFGGVAYVVESIGSDDGVTVVFRMVRLPSGEISRKGLTK